MLNVDSVETLQFDLVLLILPIHIKRRPKVYFDQVQISSKSFT